MRQFTRCVGVFVAVAFLAAERTLRSGVRDARSASPMASPGSLANARSRAMMAACTTR
jgi:hypothetical protein